MKDRAEELADWIMQDGWLDRKTLLAAIRRHYPEQPQELKPNCCCSTCGMDHYSGLVADEERRERNDKRRAARRRKARKK